MTMTNLSYLYIHEEWSRMEVNMRQSHYGFWRVYFPIVAARYPGKLKIGLALASGVSVWRWKKDNKPELRPAVLFFL